MAEALGSNPPSCRNFFFSSPEFNFPNAMYKYISGQPPVFMFYLKYLVIYLQCLQLSLVTLQNKCTHGI